MTALKEHGTAWWKLIIIEGEPTAILADSRADDSVSKGIRKCYTTGVSIKIEDLDEDMQEYVQNVWKAHSESIIEIDGYQYEDGYMWQNRRDYLEREPVSCVAHSGGAAASLIWTRDIIYPDGTSDRVFSQEIDTVAQVTASLVKIDQYMIEQAEVKYNNANIKAQAWFGDDIPE